MAFLDGSTERLCEPMVDYISDRGGEVECAAEGNLA